MGPRTLSIPRAIPRSASSNALKNRAFSIRRARDLNENLGSEPDISSEIALTRDSVHGQAASKLRSAIMAGVVKPGDHLVESELCAHLGVSRPSVREALRTLEVEGLLVMMPNRGPHVLILNAKATLDIMKAVSVLGCETAALCACLRTDPQIEAMLQGLGLIAHAVRSKNGPLSLSSTERLYGLMSRVAGSTVIDELMSRLRARIAFLFGQSFRLHGRAKSHLGEMRALVEAIAVGNGNTARLAAETHFEKSAQAIRSVAPDGDDVS